jgi:hypothetical protein
MKLNKLANKRVFDFVITNTQNVDKVGDTIPSDEIGEALDSWLLHDAPMTDVHSNRKVGKGLRWWHGNDGMIYGRGIIHDDSTMADKVWEKIKDGTYASVSIGGAAWGKVANQFGGQDLRDLEIMEVAVCPEGMHQDANIMDKNELAKAFFLKANIQKEVFPPTPAPSEVVNKPGEGTHSEKFDRCVEHVKESNPTANAFAVCTAQLGEDAFNKVESKTGGFQMTDVKKEEAEPPVAPETKEPGMAQLLAVLERIEAKLGVTPQVSGAMPQYSKESPFGGSGIGTAPVNPDPKGGEVKLPVNPDMKRKPFGEASNGGDQGMAITQKEKDALKAELLAEMKKSFTTVSTPDPAVEKTQYGKKDRLEEMLERSYAVAKGKAKVEDFQTDMRKEVLQREIEKLDSFAEFKKKGGA